MYTCFFHRQNNHHHVYYNYMKWMIIRIILYTTVACCVLCIAQFFIATYYRDQVYTSPKDLLFVAQAPQDDIITSSLTHSQQWLIDMFAPRDTQPNGSVFFPFHTVQQALDAVEQTGITTIVIDTGTYNETLTVPPHTTLIGLGDVTLRNENLLGATLTIHDHTYITRMHIAGSRYAVLIPHNTTATFHRTTFSDAHDYGVMMQKGYHEKEKAHEDAKREPTYVYHGKTDTEIAAMPHILFKNCTVERNKNQGMYLQQGRVTIDNCTVTQNGEEGIDLHPHMHVHITNTRSTHNGESGLETEVYDNIVTIENSTFTHNQKSGIALLTSFGIGTIFVTNNTVTDNVHYGIRCAIHKQRPKKPRPFFQSVLHEKNMRYENNARGAHAPECFSF